MITAPWLLAAHRYLGQAEIPGPGSSAWIRSLWHGLKGGAWFWDAIGKGDDSQLPWCGAFVARCMQDAGIDYPARYASAKAWLDWGSRLTGPAVGCVVVLEREGGGHVGFVTGRTTAGNLLVLGGNQGDKVCEKPFSFSRAIGYRWPMPALFEPTVGASSLPIYVADSALSEREA